MALFMHTLHSEDGMDEISPFEKTSVVELKEGEYKAIFN